MRLFRVSVAATLVGVLSGATPLLAGSAGWVSGHALDAGGRPLASLTVELVEAWRGAPIGAPLRAKVTDGRGAWSFGSVPPGDYVVRVIARDRTAGVPVSVTEASGVAGVLIVTPSLPPTERSSQAVAAAAARNDDDDDAIMAIIGAALVTGAAVWSVLYARDES